MDVLLEICGPEYASFILQATKLTPVMSKPLQKVALWLLGFVPARQEHIRPPISTGLQVDSLNEVGEAWWAAAWLELRPAATVALLHDVWISLAYTVRIEE